MNIQEFLTKHPLKIESVKLMARSGGNKDDWSKTANHYQIKISENGAQFPHKKPVFVTEYSMGSGLKGRPTLETVLESLSSDISCANDSFESFCDNCGYDQDSRKAYKIYEACQVIAKDLEALLGRRGIQDLLEVEW